MEPQDPATPKIGHKIIPLGNEVQFLLPSLKLRERDLMNVSPVDQLEKFLVANYAAFTAHTGNIEGNWKDESGKEIVGEHRLYSVAFDVNDQQRFDLLMDYLAKLAVQLGERCIYYAIGRPAFLVYPLPPEKKA